MSVKITEGRYAKHWLVYKADFALKDLLIAMGKVPATKPPSGVTFTFGAKSGS